MGMKCYPFILLGFIWRCLFSPKKTLTDWGGEVFFLWRFREASVEEATVTLISTGSFVRGQVRDGLLQHGTPGWLPPNGIL